MPRMLRGRRELQTWLSWGDEVPLFRSQLQLCCLIHVCPKSAFCMFSMRTFGGHQCQHRDSERWRGGGDTAGPWCQGQLVYGWPAMGHQSLQGPRAFTPAPNQAIPSALLKLR